MTELERTRSEKIAARRYDIVDALRVLADDVNPAMGDDIRVISDTVECEARELERITGSSHV